MKFTIKFYDADVEIEEEFKLLWEERCWVTLDRSLLTIDRKVGRIMVRITNMEIDSGTCQPNNCFIVWGFVYLDIKRVWKWVKIEMYSASRNITKTN